MIDKLTKTFFDTFGIEPDITSCYHRCKEDVNCKECNEAKVIYPQITDRILLELICILNDYTGIDVRATKNEELKKELLNHCIELIEYELYDDDDITNFKHQVRTLFKEV